MIASFICAMGMHPEIQKKAQLELEEIVGLNRLPAFEDFRSLPYIHAIYLECMRWLPVAPIAVPHRLKADDYYDGYFIPEGTLVIPVRIFFFR